MGRIRPQHHTNQKFPGFLKALVVSSTLFLGQNAVSAELIDRLAAEVNGAAITLSEAKVKVEKGPLIEISPFPAKESDPPLQVAIQDLINTKLVMQKAQELEIEVTDANLNEEIDKFMKSRNLTKEALNTALAQEGMTYDKYKEDFRKNLIMNQFQGREIVPQVKISDRDVQLYYLRTSGSAAENVRLVLRQLQISLPPDGVASVKEGKHSLVDKAYQELEGGMPFEQVVKIYSDNDEARKNGGLMTPLYVKDLAPLFQGAVKDLDEGKYSKPIETPVGYFIFYVEKKEFSGSEEYVKQKPQLENALRQEEMGRLLSRWIEGQRKKADIKILAVTP
ncbi:MAG: SurA N-terminal domain-containing protein [Chitinophagaceae bacterium]|nr:SurA N-terminal domain-containing protein [Oligoflexus sp.]